MQNMEFRELHGPNWCQDIEWKCAKVKLHEKMSINFTYHMNSFSKKEKKEKNFEFIDRYFHSMLE